MSIRPARFSDLDAIAWISVAATPFDLVCDYRFPKREEYPEDFAHSSRIRMGEYMAQAATGATHIIVYETPNGSEDGVKVIAYAVWEFPKGHVEHAETKALLAEERDVPASMNDKPTDNHSRRDASPARMKAYRTQMGIAKDLLFDQVYGAENYLYLGLLATHPSCQQWGAAKALVQWGLYKAKRMGWTVTLFSSPMGKLVYGNMGFVDAGQFRTQVEEEEEYLDTPGMVLKKGDW